MVSSTVLCSALKDDKSAASILELIEKCPHSVEQPNDDGRYPLHLACWHKYNKDGGIYDTVIRKLVKLFPKALQSKDKNCRTQLHVAIDQSCTTEVICLIIEQYSPYKNWTMNEIIHFIWPAIFCVNVVK
jgi:hypothetical protein